MLTGITLLIVGANEEKRQEKVQEILVKIFPKAPKFNPNKVLLQGNIGIDQVRDFKTKLSQKPYSGNIQVGLAEIEQITTEAQNALLKLIEEPQYSTQIIISVSSSDKLLPTIVSRCKKIFTSDKLNLSAFSKDTLEAAQIISDYNISKKFALAANIKGEEVVNWSNEQITFWHQVFLAQLGVTSTKHSEIAKLSKKHNLTKTFKILKGFTTTLNLLKINVNPQLLLENLFLSF